MLSTYQTIAAAANDIRMLYMSYAKDNVYDKNTYKVRVIPGGEECTDLLSFNCFESGFIKNRYLNEQYNFTMVTHPGSISWEVQIYTKFEPVRMLTLFDMSIFQMLDLVLIGQLCFSSVSSKFDFPEIDRICKRLEMISKICLNTISSPYKAGVCKITDHVQNMGPTTISLVTYEWEDFKLSFNIGDICTCNKDGDEVEIDDTMPFLWQEIRSIMDCENS